MNIALAAPRATAPTLPTPAPRPRLGGITAETVFVGRGNHLGVAH